MSVARKLAYLALVGTVLGTVACTGATGSNEIKLTLMATSGARPAVEDAIKAFEASHEGVTIAPVFTDDAAMLSVLPQQLAGGNASDVFSTWPGTYSSVAAGELGKRGFLLDLSDQPWVAAIPETMKDFVGAEGWTEERGFQAAKMNSFNHYCLGSIGEWLYEYAAGIGQEAESAGFSRLRIAPQVGGTLTSVSASYETPRGRVSSAWHRDGDDLTVSIEVPLGAPATVVLPFVPDGDAVGDRDPGVGGPRALRKGASVAVSAEPGVHQFRGRL